MFFQLSGHWHYKGAGNGRGWELMCLIVLFRGLLVSPELLICYVRRGSFRLAPLGEFGMSTRFVDNGHFNYMFVYDLYDFLEWMVFSMLFLNGHWHYMGVGNGRGCELMCLQYVVPRIASFSGLGDLYGNRQF